VILVDANILLYAHVEDFPQHEGARGWLDAQLSGGTKVGLPWESLLAFVRLATNPRVFDRPEPVADAWAQVEDWLESGPAWIPTPTDRHREVLAGLIPAVTRAHLVPDAHLAALAIEHGLVLVSSDGDFARFPGLRWRNPLQPS
jgi:toxin-antitoxin system PIN domain toxin